MLKTPPDPSCTSHSIQPPEATTMLEPDGVNTPSVTFRADKVAGNAMGGGRILRETLVLRTFVAVAIRKRGRATLKTVVVESAQALVPMKDSSGELPDTVRACPTGTAPGVTDDSTGAFVRMP